MAYVGDIPTVETQTVLDNGTVLWRDPDGNVTAAQDNQGNPVRIPGAEGSGIVQQFANLLQYGVRAAINSRYGLANAQPQAVVVTQPQAQTRTVLMVLLIGALGVAAYQLAKKG